jgi:hypothetical protein
MSSFNIKWTKELRERAKAEDKGLFAIGVDVPIFGKAEIHNCVKKQTATGLLFFAIAISKGKSPWEAFHSIDWTSGGPEETEAKAS